MGTVFAVDALFHRINHALFDDGDICFLTLHKDGEPLETRMEFIDPCEVKETDTHHFQDILDINHRSDQFTNEMLGKPLPVYTVTAHRDPVKFIQNVEAIHAEKERTRIENDAWLKDYYTKQMTNQ